MGVLNWWVLAERIELEFDAREVRRKVKLTSIFRDKLFRLL